MNSTEKTKAVELVKKFLPYVETYKRSVVVSMRWDDGEQALKNAKSCALIVCDEIMKATFIYDSQDHEFAEKVKQEIQSLTINDIS